MYWHQQDKCAFGGTRLILVASLALFWQAPKLAGFRSAMGAGMEVDKPIVSCSQKVPRSGVARIAWCLHGRAKLQSTKDHCAPLTSPLYPSDSTATSLRRSPTSSSCYWLTIPGALVSRHFPPPLLGNAMTSRMLPVPQSKLIWRSTPSAKPPCGGHPQSSACSRKPNSA